MSADSNPRPALPDSVQQLLATLVAMLHNRLELLALELEEEKRRVLTLLAWGALAIALTLVTLVVVAVWVTVMFWESQREWALALVVLAFVGATVGVWWQLKRQLVTVGGAFGGSLQELRDDYATLAAGGQPARAADSQPGPP